MKLNKFEIFFYIIVVIFILLLGASARAQQNNPTIEIQASGGTYTLVKSVIAGGGREKGLAPISEHSTTAQTIAGYKSTGGNFTIYSGFWTPENFAPTAATATVGGRVTTNSGKGIRNALVTITFPTGESRTTLSGTSGIYRFVDVSVGESYVFTVAAKRFRFSQATQVIQILEDTQDINFVADELKLLNGAGLNSGD
jgi:hypothetical protein